eukprot:c293_g1_i1 orf=57-212(-)
MIISTLNFTNPYSYPLNLEAIAYKALVDEQLSIQTNTLQTTYLGTTANFGN